MSLPVRAKRGYIKGKRYDKAGRVVASQDHGVSGLQGAVSAKEMEADMIRIADEVGASHEDIVVETYENGESERETNPAIGNKFERYTRSVVTPAFQEGYDRIFGSESTMDRMKRKKISGSE